MIIEAWRLASATCRDSLTGRLLAKDLIGILRDLFSVEHEELKYFFERIFLIEGKRIEIEEEQKQQENGDD